jgi:membrane protein YqaA with SNARE-associated domain
MDLFKLSILIFTIGLSFLIYYYRRRIAEFAKLGYLGIFLASLLANATILFPAPVFALVLVVGRVLNPLKVGVISALGASLGEITGYFVGYGGQAVVGEYPQMEEWVRSHGFITIFLAAALPNPFFDVAGILAGITHFPLEQFIIATFLGTCVKYILIAMTGKYILK